MCLSPKHTQLGFFIMRDEEKVGALTWLLRELIPEKEQAMVFCATRHHAEYVVAILRQVRVAVVLLCCCAVCRWSWCSCENDGSIL